MVARDVVTCEICIEGALKCQECSGSGLVSSINGQFKTIEKCPICMGMGYLECPLCYKFRINNIISRIKTKIKEILSSNKKEIQHLISIFENLLDYEKIKVHIDSAQKYSVMYRINRHDLYHVLHVTANAIELFQYMCLPKQSPPFRPSFSHSLSLEVIILSAFCHDIKRSFSKDHASLGAIEIGRLIKEFYENSAIIRGEEIISAIQSCVYYHSGENKLPNNIEDTIITLADGLDCGQHRVQPFFDEKLELDEDKSPMEYISDISIENVEFFKTNNHIVEFVFYLIDNAGYQKILDFQKRIENTMLSSSTNRNNFALKRTSNNWRQLGWQSDTLIIWP